MSVSTSSAAMFRPSAQTRALALCVFASLALHALVLLLPGLRPGAPAPAATHILTATFAPRVEAGEPRPADATKPVEPEPVLPSSEPVLPKSEPVLSQSELVLPKPELVPLKPELVLPRPEQVPPKPEPVRPRPMAQLRVPRPVISTPLPVPGPESGPAVPRVAAVAPAPPPAFSAAAPAGSASSASAAGSVEAQPAAASPPARAAPSGSDADDGTLDRYRLALIESAKRYKRYPAQAIDKGWQGRVEVRLVVGADGMIQSSLIKASSGHEILDDQALDMVKKAKPLTRIPAALRGREFTVDIPVIFDLQAG